MTESYWQTLNDQHPFFAPMIRHDGCKCLLIDLLHETSQWQTLIQWSAGSNSQDQSSMVLSNSNSVSGILCITESYCQTFNDQHFLAGVNWGKKTRPKRDQNEIRNLPEKRDYQRCSIFEKSKHFHFEEEEGRSPRSKQKRAYYILQRH